MKIRPVLFILLLVGVTKLSAQDVSLFQQFNGRFDYVAIGNTLNLNENGPLSQCEITTSSSATLQLQDSQSVIAAYLYWAGSDTGDFDIAINGTPITAERTFNDALDEDRLFFAAFADVTTIIQTQGNVEYTISDFDISAIIDPYCPSGTNFGGWAITIIYQDDGLPLNQLNVYDGLQSVPDELTITLDNLNVLDNENAKIGFVAWEGDRALAVNEQLSINGNTISNFPLNPANNAFNGTNSFTGTTDLYNMDIDVYNIQNNINIGDTSATISLTSGQDFVMINNIITVLNSQLPDATITINDIILECDSRIIDVDYIVNNINSTGLLPLNTPIAFYADGILVGQSQTLTDIPIGGNEAGTISISIPNTINSTFDLNIIVDDDGSSMGIVTEINENNNNSSTTVQLLIIPAIKILPDLISCNLGFEVGEFNLLNGIKNEIDVASSVFQFYTNPEDLRLNLNAITSPETYSNSVNPEIIYVRVETLLCFEIYQFDLIVENCPPNIPEGFSPNDDQKNDSFNIDGLYDIFINHKLQIYNRLGTLIFEGDNHKPWLGFTNRGLNNQGNLVPVGTYYYVLNLNDPDYKPINGWVYVNY